MIRPKLEYVVSAVGMLGIYVLKIDEPWIPKYRKIINELMTETKRRSVEDSPNYDPLISMLYNAYNEGKYIDKLKAVEWLNADATYSDSGGLQVVTAGQNITPELRKEVYRDQAVSDYAMCFDNIPLETVSKIRMKNERALTHNKIFNQARHPEAALATGQNIKEQIDYFRKVNALTKVIIIVQGNTAQDMVDYYRNIVSCLDEEDFKFIGGMAVADTCMGNGPLESVEMLHAAKLISLECHDNIKNHLHFLGVGAVNRMRPIVYLLRSGYLDTFKRISYDSSTHSSAFLFGQMRINGKVDAIGAHKTPYVEENFRKVYKLLEKTFNNYTTEDEFIKNVLYRDKRTTWSWGQIRNHALTYPDENAKVTTLLCNPAYCFYHIHNFVWNVDKLMVERPSGERPEIEQLLKVKTIDDMTYWFRHFGCHMDSKRIIRAEERVSLEGLFV